MDFSSLKIDADTLSFASPLQPAPPSFTRKRDRPEAQSPDNEPNKPTAVIPPPKKKRKIIKDIPHTPVPTSTRSAHKVPITPNTPSSNMSTTSKLPPMTPIRNAFDLIRLNQIQSAKKSKTKSKKK
eukprot:390668_1